MPVNTKRVYADAEDADGRRILVMRFWPRGISKDKVDAWEKDLGAPPDLIKDWKAGSISWGDFSRRYRTAMRAQKEKIAALANAAKKQTLTLLCSCPEEKRCHRWLLKQMIEPATHSEPEARPKPTKRGQE